MLHEFSVSGEGETDPEYFYVRAKPTAQEGTELTVSARFEPSNPATSGEGSGGQVNEALDKVRITVTGGESAEFDFTRQMLVEPATQGRFIYPCITLCENCDFLRYRTGSLENVQEVQLEVRDPNGQVVWEATDAASADWKEQFPECRTNKLGSFDLGNEPNTPDDGQTWKFLDPGVPPAIPDQPNHSNYPPLSSTYTARMTVKFTGGGNDIVKELTFQVRTRDVLIYRVTDPTIGVRGEGAARACWDLAASEPITTEVPTPVRVVKLSYVDHDFGYAYRSLTPRGRLLSMNHGYAIDCGALNGDADGADLFGAVFMDGPGDHGTVYEGFSINGNPGSGTALDDGNPVVSMQGNLQVHGVFVDLAHCHSAHRSGDDDAGPSVHETLASIANTQGVSSARVRGYVGKSSGSDEPVRIGIDFGFEGIAGAEARAKCADAMAALAAEYTASLGLTRIANDTSSPVPLRYEISLDWARHHDMSLIYATLSAVLTKENVQPEINKRLAPGQTITIAASADRANVVLPTHSPSGHEIPGDDEGAPATVPPAQPQVGQDCDDDANPSAQTDTANEDNPFVQEVVTP